MQAPKRNIAVRKKWFCYGNKIRENRFLLLQPKILLLQPNVLLTELNILLLQQNVFCYPYFNQ